MSKFNFCIDTDTTAAENFSFAGNQRAKAAAYAVQRVFCWRDLRGNAHDRALGYQCNECADRAEGMGGW